jgi:hypothetical protein
MKKPVLNLAVAFEETPEIEIQPITKTVAAQKRRGFWSRLLG